MFTINKTRRKASRPATALTAMVTINSVPSAKFFGAIIGRASINNVNEVTSSNLFSLPEVAAWTTITADLPAKLEGGS
jgi:hypothetical protein